MTWGIFFWHRLKSGTNFFCKIFIAKIHVDFAFGHVNHKKFFCAEFYISSVWDSLKTPKKLFKYPRIWENYKKNPKNKALGIFKVFFEWNFLSKYKLRKIELKRFYICEDMPWPGKSFFDIVWKVGLTFFAKFLSQKFEKFL